MTLDRTRLSLELHVDTTHEQYRSRHTSERCTWS
jgi:hypothetical protein